MGIPKFFRYISERWPLISQLVNDNEIAEFDNLYLDMNSILHNCTHKDADLTHQLTQDEMYLAIFNYIEHLFTLIKPKKLFYMAIDGVAPRAKMNQQRARRFRTALDAENARKKAIKEGTLLPSNDPFDSNCITPGTVFMAKLTEQLRYFIHKKVSEDSSWQGIEIVLSGHEVPGEGEHKIMERIRHARVEPDYDPNVRHCLYGLDADLIMLGLSSHDPHFAVLREEVVFGKQPAKKSKQLTDEKFYLLHLSLAREYLEIEFEGAKDSSSIPFDFERVLDDFILINFFIGNDFLPELPSLLINDGALPTIIESYKRYLQKCTGYLSDGGIIDFQNLAIWLDEISLFEYRKFEEKSEDVEWFNAELGSISVKGADKAGSVKLTVTSRQKELVRSLKPTIVEANNVDKPDASSPSSALPQIELPELSEQDLQFIRVLAEKTYMRVIQNPEHESKHTLILDIDGIPEDEDDDGHDERLLSVNRMLKKYENATVVKEENEQHKKEIYNEKFTQWRNEYYRKNFDFKGDEVNDKIIDVVDNYLEGLQWVLLYYYRGCPSWEWFFRYHYSPRITDIKMGIKKQKYIFELGKPFRPFEQLMGVLPARSKALVPAAYHTLMTDELSPIIDFYPHDFALDMNGKKNDWEAVVKIPFVDQKRLLKALESRESQLSPEEKKRNGFGTSLRFVYNPQVDAFFPSPLPGHFLDLAHSHCVELQADPYPENVEFKFSLQENAKIGEASLAGFPSLKTIPFVAKLAKADVEVFQRPSQNESVVVTIKDLYAEDEASDIATKLAGTSIYVGWPFLREATVVAISDEMFRYGLDARNPKSPLIQEPHPEKTLDGWHKSANAISQKYYSKSGVNIGKVHKVVHVKLLKGLKRTSDGAYVKEFGGPEDPEFAFGAQTIVENVISEDERYKQRDPLPIEQEYPIGSQVIFLGKGGYGNPVSIKGYAGDKLDVNLLKLERAEPNIGTQSAQLERQILKYIPSYEVAKIVSLHPMFLGQITSKFFVQVGGKRVDLGLNLKNEARRQKVLGYTRKSLRSWEFSGKAIQLIKKYRTECPVIFRGLLKASAGRNFTPELQLEAVSRDQAAELVKEARDWLKANAFVLEAVDFETEALSTITVEKIENYIISYFRNPEPVKEVEYKNIPRNALLVPSSAYHELRTQRFDLGDRVVSALDFGKVKLYNRGTVIGIDSATSKVTLTVLFDQEFDQGSTLGGICKTSRGLSVDAGSVVNLTNRQLVFGQKRTESAAAPNSNAHAKGLRPAPPASSVWGKSQATTTEGKPLPTNKPAINKTAIEKKQPKLSTKGDTPVSVTRATRKAPMGVVKVLQKPKESDATGQNAVDQQASTDLMAMLKSGADSKPTGSPKDNNEILNTFKGGKNVKQSHQILMGTLMNTYGGAPPLPFPNQFQAPPPPSGFGIPPPPFHVGGPPPLPGVYPLNVDENASVDLMAQLHINGGESNEISQGQKGPGRGGNRGRGNTSG